MSVYHGSHGRPKRLPSKARLRIGGPEAWCGSEGRTDTRRRRPGARSLPGLAGAARAHTVKRSGNPGRRAAQGGTTAAAVCARAGRRVRGALSRRRTGMRVGAGAAGPGGACDCAVMRSGGGSRRGPLRGGTWMGRVERGTSATETLRITPRTSHDPAGQAANVTACQWNVWWSGAWLCEAEQFETGPEGLQFIKIKSHFIAGKSHSPTHL